MYRFFLYVILVILYLGLAKILSPTEFGVQYLQNEKSFSKIFKGNQITSILIDSHATGFLIKTYYQKYRVIYGFQNVEEMIVRTSKEFAVKNIPNMGMSLYRNNENVEETLPLPPGSLYIGNREFGQWKKMKSGKMKWSFYKVYKNIPRYLGWGTFRPDMDFYQKMRTEVSLNQPFYGPNNEFGLNGRITRENFPYFFTEERTRKVEFKNLFIDYFKENF